MFTVLLYIFVGWIKIFVEDLCNLYCFPVIVTELFFGREKNGDYEIYVTTNKYILLCQRSLKYGMNILWTVQ